MIDAHQHFWDPARGDYGWLQPGSNLYRAYGPADLLPHLAQSGVQGSILVQAAATDAETDYLLGLARVTPWVLGVVGWLDLAAGDVVERLADRAREPLFVGVRPMLQDLSDRSWILRPPVRAGLEALEARGLAFDALVRADQLLTVATLAERHARLAIVLDHAGKPPLGRASEMALWRADIRRVAESPNVVCKLSGLTTELPAGNPVDCVDQCIDEVLELFGPERLLWGSDWPVATLATQYPDWLARCRVRVGTRLPGALAGIFGGNARRVYRLTADRVA